MAVHGKLSERAIREFREIAARVASHSTDEQLGIRPEDYAEDLARYCPDGTVLLASCVKVTDGNKREGGASD